MTAKQLEGIAMQALNMAKSDIQFNRWGSFLLATYHQGEQLHRMRKVERLINELAGEDWLNSGGAKDQAFGVLRGAVKFRPPDAVVFVTLANQFTETAKMQDAPPAIRREILDGGHDRQHQAVQEGWLEVHDAFCATAQTAELVCIALQRLLGRVFTGQPEIRTFPQSQFDGRMKMFGEGKHCIDLDLEQLLKGRVQ